MVVVSLNSPVWIPPVAIHHNFQLYGIHIVEEPEPLFLPWWLCLTNGQTFILPAKTNKQPLHLNGEVVSQLYKEYGSHFGRNTVDVVHVHKTLKELAVRCPEERQAHQQRSNHLGRESTKMSAVTVAMSRNPM